MLGCLITVIMAFGWLLYESDWLRVRLIVGAISQLIKTIDISGFGGGYEATCQAMLIAGMEWLKEHPSFTFEGYKAYRNITGIVVPPETQLAKELDDILLKAARDDMTGAQHQAVISHLAYIQAHGHEQWLEDAKKHGREIIEVNEADIERQVTAAQLEWQQKLASGYDPMAEMLKKIPKDHIISLDPNGPESVEAAAQKTAEIIKGEGFAS